MIQVKKKIDRKVNWSFTQGQAPRYSQILKQKFPRKRRDFLLSLSKYIACLESYGLFNFKSRPSIAMMKRATGLSQRTIERLNRFCREENLLETKRLRGKALLLPSGKWTRRFVTNIQIPLYNLINMFKPYDKIQGELLWAVA